MTPPYINTINLLNYYLANLEHEYRTCIENNNQNSNNDINPTLYYYLFFINNYPLFIIEHSADLIEFAKLLIQDEYNNQIDEGYEGTIIDYFHVFCNNNYDDDLYGGNGCYSFYFLTLNTLKSILQRLDF